MINRIHRIWLGEPMPARFREYGVAWEELNPEHSLTDWGEDVLDLDLVNRDVLEDLRKNSLLRGADMNAYYTQVADVVDYELLYMFGGWYFNTDVKPIKPLAELTYDPALPAIAYEDDVHLVNMAMYSPPGSELFGKIIELLPKRYFKMPGGFMNATTGVQLIMQAVGSYSGGLTTFHRSVFNPIHWSEFGYGEVPATDGGFPEQTVAVHEWYHKTTRRGQKVI